MPTVVIVTIAVALLFDVFNGLHDAANSIATVVSTRVLSPRVAVLWAAAFNFLALWIFKVGVAKTIANTITIDYHDPAFVYVVMSGVFGAIVWNLITWWLGLPSSSTHALIGGLLGAGITYAGPSVAKWGELEPTLVFILLAPIIGLVAGSLIMFIVYWLLRKMRPQKVDRAFRILQLFSAGAYSMGHGGNDAQKTIGVVVMVLVANGTLHIVGDGPHKGDLVEGIPTWLIFASYGCMAFGTAIGGWRIVKTMGMGLTHLKPVGGFCAEVAGATTLFVATALKIPVSTTHTITGAIVGVGSVYNSRSVRWGLASRIVWAWVLTIPMAGLVGALATLITHAFGAW